MANRHKAFKKGGKVELDYGNKNVAHEAKEKKSGGKVKHKATGGSVKAEGKAAGGRLDKRARGGGVGADMKSSPFSHAHYKTNGDAGK